MYEAKNPHTTVRNRKEPHNLQQKLPHNERETKTKTTNQDIKSNEREHERTPRTRVLRLVSFVKKIENFTWECYAVSSHRSCDVLKTNAFLQLNASATASIITRTKPILRSLSLPFSLILFRHWQNVCSKPHHDRVLHLNGFCVCGCVANFSEKEMPIASYSTLIHLCAFHMFHFSFFTSSFGVTLHCLSVLNYNLIQGNRFPAHIH